MDRVRHNQQGQMISSGANAGTSAPYLYQKPRGTPIGFRRRTHAMDTSAHAMVNPTTQNKPRRITGG